MEISGKLEGSGEQEADPSTDTSGRAISCFVVFVPFCSRLFGTGW
jgi:hypothetical protein